MTSLPKVIMDEVGRGTSVKDGLAIAFAVVHHLYFKNNCRALFATHFHELTDMLGCTLDYRGAGVFRKVGFFCTDVEVTEVRPDQLLIAGVSPESHAKILFSFFSLALLHTPTAFGRV
jgi:DNA mismatch repair ATPase MutS